MKCQGCDENATIHVTELADGKPVEYHVCEKHARELSSLKVTEARAHSPSSAYRWWDDAEIRSVFQDPISREKMAAYLLPALCVGLVDQNANVRVLAAFGLIQLGGDARSALGALRDAMDDPDDKVRRVAKLAIEFIESDAGTGPGDSQLVIHALMVARMIKRKDPNEHK
jgi:hypothetical protein